MTTALATAVYTAAFSTEHQDLMVSYSGDSKGGNITAVVSVPVPDYVQQPETACRFADTQLIKRKWQRVTDWIPTESEAEYDFGPTEFTAEVAYLGIRPTFR